MSQSVINIIKGLVGLVVPQEWSVPLQEIHITMHFLSEIANETTEKVFLPLQTLEFKEIIWGW